MENITLTTIALQIGSAFVGGGVFSVLVSEWMSKRRDSRAVILDHVTSLIRAYYHYVRLLRQAPEKRSDEALDHAHAAFVAEIRILSFNTKLKPTTEDIWKISQRFANLRNAATQDQVKIGLGKIYGEFDAILENLMKNLKI